MTHTLRSISSEGVGGPPGEIFAFDPVRIDVARHVVTCDGQAIALAPKTFDLLLILVRSGGRVLSRQELVAALWPDTFVEEANLSFQISTLRRALGVGAEQWIETVPKVGYRFTPQVTCEPAAVSPPFRAPPAEADGITVAPTVSMPDGSSIRRREPIVGGWRIGARPAALRVLASLAVVLAVIGLIGWLRARSAPTPSGPDAGAVGRVVPSPGRVPELSRIDRLTKGPGREYAPAISPDRKWVAYLASSAAGHTDVWVRFVGGGDAINLTESADLDIAATVGVGGLAIAPEGDRLAVMAKPRGSTDSFATWEIRAPLPGAPHKLLDAGLLATRWSPDGRQITFIRAGSSAGDALLVADADGTNRREIIPADAGIHIHWPAWAGDGYVYFIRTRSMTDNLDQADIYRVHAGGGTPEPVVTTPRRAMFPMAAPGGIFYASDAASADLGLYWRPTGGGNPIPITRGIGDYSAASLSLDGRAIVATHAELRQSLIRLTPTETGVEEQSVTDGYTGDLDPTMSPRANRLVFSSSRGGSRWLWSSELDGSQPRPLTSGDVLDQWPSMSPDGRTVAFVSDRGGHRGIWLIASDGGSPRRLVQAETLGGLSWTRDGRGILYAADHERWPALFKVTVADGQVRRLPTPGVATDPACSPSDELVAYMSPRKTGPSTPSFTELRFVDLEGRVRFGNLPPTPPLPSGFSTGFVAWSPDGRRLAIVSQNASLPASIWMIEPAAAEPRFHKLIELPPAPRIRGLTWTPDGRSLIVGKHDPTVSDIVLIELRP